MKELNAFRHQLATLCKQGLKAKSELDRFVEMDLHDRRTDIVRLLKAATSPQLAQLARAFAEDLLVREKYVGRGDEDAPRGCLVFHLFGFRSNGEFFQWDVPDDLLVAVSRVIRAWDYRQITADQVRAALDSEIACRELAAPPPRLGSPARVRVEPQGHTLVG